MSGEIDDANISRFEEALSPRLTAQLRVIVLDLTRVSFLGVAALEALRTAQVQFRRRDVRLPIVATNREVLRSLHIAGALEAIPAHDTVQSALQQSPQPSGAE